MEAGKSRGGVSTATLGGEVSLTVAAAAVLSVAGMRRKENRGREVDRGREGGWRTQRQDDNGDLGRTGR